ncbi:MAG: hypothetical protein ACTSQU_00775 [Promethearchaeota archaeon]
MLHNFFETFTQAIREFEYDYIFVDSIFLTIWIAILIKYKKWKPLKFGVFTGFLVYFIDSIVWFNLPAGPNYPTGTYIREYWIGGIYMPRPLGDYFWLKFGADFMMTFSYAMFAFGWLWIMFENFAKRNLKEILIFTLLIFTFWMLIPLFSLLIPLNNTQVRSIRYMDTQMIAWSINLIAGYVFLSLIYGTKKFGSRKPKTILYVFVVGCVGAFFMEFPLLIFGIRPTGILFLFYNVLFMFNQGTPYLYILYDNLPWLFSKIKKPSHEEIKITI